MPWISTQPKGLLVASLLGCLFSAGLARACPAGEAAPLPSIKRTDSRVITIIKEYDVEQNHFRLTMLDSTGRFQSILSKKKPLVRQSRRGPEQMADVYYHFLQGKDIVSVAKVKMDTSCYTNYNTRDGWIVVRNKRLYYLVDDMNRLMHEVDAEMGKRANIKVSEIKHRLVCYEYRGPDEPTCWDTPIFRMIEQMDSSEKIKKK